MAGWRDKHGSDPKLTYNQRSSNPNRKAFSNPAQPQPLKRKAPKTPTCCYVGCFEPREPGEPFCERCKDIGSYE